MVRPAKRALASPRGRTMIIVTHEMQFARAIADRVIFLDSGKIVEESTPETFFDHPKTERAQKFLRTFLERSQHNVVQHGQMREQLIALEYHADALAQTRR